MFRHTKADGTPKAELTESEARTRCLSNPTWRAYHCTACDHWHVGRSKGKQRQPPTEWVRLWDRVRTELEIAS